MVRLLLFSFFEVSLVHCVHKLGANLADGSLRERQKLKEPLPSFSFKTFGKVRQDRHRRPANLPNKIQISPERVSPNEAAHLARKVAASLKRFKITEVLNEWHAKIVAEDTM